MRLESERPSLRIRVRIVTTMKTKACFAVLLLNNKRLMGDKMFEYGFPNAAKL